MKTPPKVQVDTMPAGQYFAYAAELLKLNPPHLTDEPILARMRRIGIEPGQSFDIEKVARGGARRRSTTAPAAAQKLMEWKVPTLARVANDWSMNTDTMGVYGNYYLKRAIVTQLGLGANLAEDAIYPLNLGDADGKPLDGANRYVLRFEKGATPRSMPSGRSRSTTQRASRSQTCSTASRSAAGCRSDKTPTARSTSISRTRARARTRRRIGCRRRRARLT